MNIKKLSALVAVSALVLTGCATAAETETDTDAAPASDFKICVYTHGDGGGFWSVAQAGAEQAGKDLGVTVDYQGSTNDSAKQAQTIEAGIAGGCDAIAASAPEPPAIEAAMLAAAAAGGAQTRRSSRASLHRSPGPSLCCSAAACCLRRPPLARVRPPSHAPASPAHGS